MSHGFDTTSLALDNLIFCRALLLGYLLLAEENLLHYSLGDVRSNRVMLLDPTLVILETRLLNLPAHSHLTLKYSWGWKTGVLSRSTILSPHSQRTGTISLLDLMRVPWISCGIF